MDNRSMLLRRTLTANALVTLVFGGLLLADRNLVTDLLGIGSAAPVVAAGLICVAFAPLLLIAARRELAARTVALLIAVDAAWFLGSLVLAAVAPITASGRALIVAQALLVAVFIALETAGLRRYDDAYSLKQ